MPFIQSPKNCSLLPEKKQLKLQSERKFLLYDEGEIKSLTLDYFKKIFNVDYLFDLHFESVSSLKRIEKQCKRALNNGFIDHECQWLGSYYRSQINNCSVHPVYIRWIDETLGYGLFAAKKIKAGSFIGQYTGFVRRRRFFKASINDYCFSYPTSCLHWIKHSVDALQLGNEMRFANHSDQPNSESTAVWTAPILRVAIRALQDIPKDQQITYNYDESYWNCRQKVANR